MVGVSGQPVAWSDTRVRTPGGEPLRGDVRLPQLDGIDPIHDPIVDAVGRTIGFGRPMIGAGAGVGLVAGVLLGGSGFLHRTGGGVLGGVLGAAAGFAAARLLEHATGRASSSSDAFVRDVDGAGTSARRGSQGERLRVVDWNVHDLIGPDGHVRTNGDAVDAIAEVIAREQPDVLVLQEVSQRSVPGGMVDGLGELAARLGATDAVLVPNGYRLGGSVKGGAILTFGETHIQDARGIRHPDMHGSGPIRRIKGLRDALAGAGYGPARDAQSTGYYPRTTTDAIITTPGGTDVRVLGMHLSGTGIRIGGTSDASGHQRQLGAIIGTLDAWDGPTLLLGDFNVRSGSDVHEWERDALGAAGLADALAGLGIDPADAPTFSSRAPRAQIDRVYASDELTPTSAAVLDDDRARAGSDHLPVRVDLVVG